MGTGREPTVIQALGWFGSGLIVASLVLRRPIAFRSVNLASAAVLLAFNLAIDLWSMVALNATILVVNGWRLRSLLAGRAHRLALHRRDARCRRPTHFPVDK